MKHTVRALSDLGEDIVLAPERWLANIGATTHDGSPLGDLVVERRERSTAANAVVLDTTHAKDGLLDIPSALRAKPSAKSAKKRALVGDLVISRLRPYLRQIAFVHPRALASIGDRELALSSEFYVLSPRQRFLGGDVRDKAKTKAKGVGKGAKTPTATSWVDLAYLLPFLLGEHAQGILAAAQEGGHHPRVPRSALFALRVPHDVTQASAQRRVSAEVMRALDTLYGAVDGWEQILSIGR